jgi:hypothetical protein
MTERLRYRDNCPVGEGCPKLEEGEDGMINVTGYLPDGTESTVAVPSSLIPGITDQNVTDLVGYIAQHFRTDMIRIQTLDQYGAASDGDDFSRYLDGLDLPASPARDDWFAKLRGEAASGKARRNLHIIREPLSDYLRYAFEWGYVYNAAAGQQIRILPVEDSLAAAHLFQVGDFSVIDQVNAIRFRYDSSGSLIGNVEVSADAAESYAALAELAWELGTDFTTWWAQHPQYHRAARAA